MKYAHLRREGWQPNPTVLKKIGDHGVASNVQVSTIETTNIDSDIFSGSFPIHTTFLFLEQNAHNDILVWIANSGASHHCCRDLDLLTEYQLDPLPLKIGNGSMVSLGHGKVYLELRQSNNTFLPICLANIRYTPSSSLNTISEELSEKCDISWCKKHQ